jgi:hypothetical protein
MKSSILIATAIVLAVGSTGAANAQLAPKPGGVTLPPGATTLAIQCIPGFTLKRESYGYTCTSAPFKCDRRYPSGDGSGVVGDRFYYRCIAIR